MKQLYKGVLTQKCNQERQTLKNSLSIATQSPDEFEYDLRGSPYPEPSKRHFFPIFLEAENKNTGQIFFAYI